MSSEPPPPYSASYPTQDDMKKASAPAPPMSAGMTSGAPPPVMTQPLPTTVIVQQIGSFGPTGQAIVCSNCQSQVVTSTEHTAGLLTWLVCVGCCIVGCDCGCCLIPFCIDDLNDVNHTCPNCNQYLGQYKRL